MVDELDNLENLLNAGPGMSLADPEMIEAGEKIAATIWTSGAEGLGVLLDRGVMYTEGSSDYNDLSEIIPSDLGECVITTAEWTGDRSGTLNLIIPSLGAKGIVSYMLALMMGTDADPENTALDEEGMDAFKESINQFLGTAAQALRQDPGGDVKIAVVETKVVDFTTSSIIDEFGNDFKLCSQGQLTIEGMGPENIYTILAESLTGIEPCMAEEGGTVGAGSIDEAINEAKENDEEVSRALSIITPLNVTLAERTMRLSEIMNLVPGSIIEFRKSSEDYLDLCLGNIIIGRGEAVIVNEFFGLQIREMNNSKTVKRSL